jgi:hypothetical protein
LKSQSEKSAGKEARKYAIQRAKAIAAQACRYGEYFAGREESCLRARPQ